jgi:CRISPR/Cas system-associated endonuclease Cas3-HD
MNEAEQDHIECRQSLLTIEFTETIIQNREASAESEFNHVMMSATFFTNLIQKKEEKQKKIEVFLISMMILKKP